MESRTERAMENEVETVIIKGLYKASTKTSVEILTHALNMRTLSVTRLRV